MKIEVRSTPFAPWELLQAHEREVLAAGRYGATAVFIGTMRDFNEGDTVRGMTLEHYPGMTERHLEKIVANAIARWALDDALVVHRVGELNPADPIVLVAVWSAHRKEAFEACRHIMEELKSSAPFWKKERLEQGTRWVEKNRSGY
ncbi:MAG TPA: molybdenum cofactor biosynthesis protein MoaE [Gammaproteobacteria bacterium]